MQAHHFFTASLRREPRGATITQIIATALAAVDPAAAVARYLRREGNTLLVGERRFDLATLDRVIIVGAGKAGAPMAYAAAQVLDDKLSAGLVVVKDGHLAELPQPTPPSFGRLHLVEAGHPVPDERGVAAAQAMVDLLADLTERDLVLAVISGGGSALLTLPVPGVSLTDLQQLTSALLACGATIGEINTLRKQLDQLKGGGLAHIAAPATLITLILSDVVGNPLDIIASGPTVPNPTTAVDALSILDRYDLVEQTPPAILAYLQDSNTGTRSPEQASGDQSFARVSNLLVGDNRQAAVAALEKARQAGFAPLLLTTSLEGEAREAGRMLAAILREIALSGNPLPRPACLIAGGETTVTLRGNGRGGRNQELALAAVKALDGLPDVALIALATDGGDGPTDAAGAVVTGATAERARALGLDPDAFLANNDAYHFFQALDDLLLTGPTSTNVNDLTLLFAW
ncbi:glycerate kinase type-2 family protein [Candidatus Chloroploca asiatica]|uniref:Glycerate kinase n=1 Tax=Candidatus Chloroploca asiatica TaxID=1506545 RepID=A0A2H3KPI5_9CHLR|nr:glycerate kinase [Candidatus Chloroploca asiatica]PDW00133.1 glycerate kinase [Candidatus Chloroploca asiatica]